MKLLLVSHGDIAEGMRKTVTTFFGGTELYTACVSYENGVASLKEKVEKHFEEWGDEQVVICSDLKGGSANQTVREYLNRPNTFLVSGTNLALILQLIMVPKVTKESLQEIIDNAKNDLMLVNDEPIGIIDDDDE